MLRKRKLRSLINGFTTVAREDKTLPSIQNNSKNPKTLPSIQNNSKNPKTLPRIQNNSKNPKHFPKSKNTSRIHSTQNSGNFGWFIEWNGPFRFGPTWIFGTSFEGGPQWPVWSFRSVGPKFQGGKTFCASFYASITAGSRRAFLCADCVCLLLEFWVKCTRC